jgi:hypothetical protein
MKKLAFCLAVVGLLGLGGQAAAVIGTIDDVPAATLLLPYFEVDLDNADGINTLFSVNNASATATLAHINVYTDASVIALDFNIYLTGYDVVTVNLRDILVNGILPRTADDARDPADTISPQGNFSQDITFASCAGFLPPPNLPGFFLDHLQASLTGQPSDFYGGLCSGIDHGDRIARGYITIDVATQCTLEAPGPTYFAGAAGNANILWGDYFLLHPAENFAQGETLVHIEADPTAFAPGDYTFYGRYVGWLATDAREALPTTFATRFLQPNPVFTGGTDLLVWRDPKVVPAAFSCAVGRPSWAPLGQEQIVIFDEEENPEVPTTLPVSPQPPGQSLQPFPWETQRTEVGGTALPVAPDFGWLFLNLNTTVTGQVAGLFDPSLSQAWVTTVMSADGLFSVGFDAVHLDETANDGNHLIIGF